MYCNFCFIIKIKRCYCDGCRMSKRTIYDCFIDILRIQQICCNYRNFESNLREKKETPLLSNHHYHRFSVRL